MESNFNFSFSFEMSKKEVKVLTYTKAIPLKFEELYKSAWKSTMKVPYRTTGEGLTRTQQTALHKKFNDLKRLNPGGISQEKVEEKDVPSKFGEMGEDPLDISTFIENVAQQEARQEAGTPAQTDRDPLAEGIPSAIHALLASKQGRLDTQELMTMGVDDMIAKAQEGIASNMEANSELEQNILHAYGHMNPGLIAARRINYPQTNLHWQAPDHVSMGENVGPEGQRFSLNIAGYTNPVGKVAMENMPHLYDPYEQYRGVFGRRREGTSHRLRDFVNQAPVTKPGRPAPISALEQNMALLDTQQLYEKMQKRAGNGDSLTRMIRGMPIGKLKARN